MSVHRQIDSAAERKSAQLLESIPMRHEDAFSVPPYEGIRRKKRTVEDFFILGVIAVTPRNYNRKRRRSNHPGQPRIDIRRKNVSRMQDRVGSVPPQQRGFRPCIFMTVRVGKNSEPPFHGFLHPFLERDVSQCWKVY